METVGYSGSGSIAQSGGTNAVASQLNVGALPGSLGTYYLQGGLLSTPVAIIPSDSSSVGSLTQTGGTNLVSANLALGYIASGSGSYALIGSSLLSATNEYIGFSGSGSFTQSGGTNALAGSSGTLILGANPGSVGTYNLSGSGVLTVTGFEVVGYSGSGSFTQNGGTNAVLNRFRLGFDANSSGTYNLLGGQLSAPTETVGYSGSGSFTQAGGTNSVGSNFNVGNLPGSGGAYHLNGGLLSAPAEYVPGDSSTASFAQSGGTNAVSDFLVLGYTPSGSSGSYGLSGSGMLSAPNEYVGYSGSGSFTQSGGTNMVQSLNLAYSASSSGVYNLTGGLLNLTGTDGLTQGTGTAAFNFSGGTFQAGSDFSTSVPIVLNSTSAVRGHSTPMATILLLAARFPGRAGCGRSARVS